MKHTRCLLYHRDCRLQVAFFARSNGELNKPDSQWHFFCWIFLSFRLAAKNSEIQIGVFPRWFEPLASQGVESRSGSRKKRVTFAIFFATKSEKWHENWEIWTERDCISQRNMPVLVALCSASEFVIFGFFFADCVSFFERTNFSAPTFLVTSAKYGSF